VYLKNGEGMSMSTTVGRGTAFERAAVRTLVRAFARTPRNSTPLSAAPHSNSSVANVGESSANDANSGLQSRLAIRRVGGAFDAGVDFVGTLSFPKRGSESQTGDTESFAVCGQCKHEQRKCGPRHVRELEGVLAARVRGSSGEGTANGAVLGFLVSQTAFTQDALRTARVSPLPIVCCRVELLGEDSEDSEPEIDRESPENDPVPAAVLRSFVLNPPAHELLDPYLAVATTRRAGMRGIALVEKSDPSSNGRVTPLGVPEQV
jgi:Required for respiratory growth protein 7